MSAMQAIHRTSSNFIVGTIKWVVAGEKRSRVILRQVVDGVGGLRWICGAVDSRRLFSGVAVWNARMADDLSSDNLSSDDPISENPFSGGPFFHVPLTSGPLFHDPSMCVPVLSDSPVFVPILFDSTAIDP
ncbi:MAG: hypothetical protein FWC50_14715, partial [Planctomycetaceae bacterium]|nr:hypothetical protein [Planctomycetaceae bacterium]